MQAQTLAISIPTNPRCNKRCPYCVSLMTEKVTPDWDLMLANVEKVKHMADRVGVTNVMLTGKGEPLIERNRVLTMLVHFKNFPLELQTNGILLTNDDLLIDTLARCGLNVVAFSVDKYASVEEFRKTFRLVREAGMITRLVVNITDWLTDVTFLDFLNLCDDIGIDQLTFRNIVVPHHIVPTKEARNASAWIEVNVSHHVVDRLRREMSEYIKAEGRFLLRLPYGASMYDVRGISLTYFDYCIQDYSDGGKDIRSLIFKDDGHLYTTWDSPASKLL